MSKQTAYDKDGNPIGAFDPSSSKITMTFKTIPLRITGHYDRRTGKSHVYDEDEQYTIPMTFRVVNTWIERDSHEARPFLDDQPTDEPSHEVSEDGVLFDKDQQLPPKHPGIYQDN